MSNRTERGGHKKKKKKKKIAVTVLGLICGVLV